MKEPPIFREKLEASLHFRLFHKYAGIHSFVRNGNRLQHSRLVYSQAFADGRKELFALHKRGHVLLFRHQHKRVGSPTLWPRACNTAFFPLAHTQQKVWKAPLDGGKPEQAMYQGGFAASVLESAASRQGGPRRNRFSACSSDDLGRLVSDDRRHLLRWCRRSDTAFLRFRIE